MRGEFGADVGPALAGAHDARIAARAERERERIDQDRFSGAGLAGKHRETLLEFEVERVDDDKIADRKMTQHGKRVLRGGTGDEIGNRKIT